MQTLLDNLTSIQWWLGVVVVGVVADFLSRFIGSKFDDYFSMISVWWRERSEKRKTKFEREVIYLVNNPEEIVTISFSELRLMNRGIFLLLLGVIQFLIGLTCMYIFKEKMVMIDLIGKTIIALIYFSGLLSTFGSMIITEKAAYTATKIRRANMMIRNFNLEGDKNKKISL